MIDDIIIQQKNFLAIKNNIVFYFFLQLKKTIPRNGPLSSFLKLLHPILQLPQAVV